MDPPKAVDAAVGVVPALGEFNAVLLSADEEAADEPPADLAVADLSGELGASGFRDRSPPCCSVVLALTLTSPPPLLGALLLLLLVGGAAVPLRRVKPRIFLEAPNPTPEPPTPDEEDV